MKDKGLGIAIAFAFIGFVVMYGATDGFSSPDQILIGSSDVTVQQTAPGVTNDIDEGYLPGYVWVDQTGAAVYVTRDTTDGAAIWTDITAGGSTFNSEEADALVTSGVDVIDFGAGFDLTDSPAGETNVLLDYTEDPINLATGEVSGTLATGNGGTGQVANTADAVLVGNGSAFVARVVPDCNVAGSAIGYEDSTDQWSCQSGLGGGSGSVTTLEEGDVQVGGADIVSIDFGPGFDLTESPDTEINIVLDLTEDQVVLTTEVTGTLPAGNGGTGQTAATADGVLVSTGAAFVVQVVPDCDTAGNAIGYDTTTDAWSCFSGYLTTVDISADTNLAAGTNITLTGDTLNVDDAFLLVGGDVGTGSFDFGGADDFEIPNSAGGAAVNAAGEITIDTTSDTLNYHDGTAEKVLQPLRHFGLTLEDPTSAEDISIWHVNFAITIQREMCVVLGSATPSVTVTLRHGTDRNAAGAELNTSGNAITSTTTGNEDVSFNDATIVADSFIWLESTAQSGTVDLLMCTWEYLPDA